MGPGDVKKLQIRALLELVAMFDSSGLRMQNRKRRRAKRIRRESGVFGVSLISLIAKDEKMVPGCKIPLVLKKMISHLERTALREEGILRVSGAAHKIQ